VEFTEPSAKDLYIGAKNLTELYLRLNSGSKKDKILLLSNNG